MTAKNRAADAKWRREVKERDGKCQVCGATWDLEVHHVVTRGKEKFRHLLENGITLCAVCHQWAHNAPAAFARDMKATSPEHYAMWLRRHEVHARGAPE